MEKCKKHHKKILPCRETHYDYDPCDCLPQCVVCVRVQKRKHDLEMKKTNIVQEIDTMYPSKSITQIKYFSFKYKPRKRLKKGDYATLDMRTGYLVKAKGVDVKFLVVN